MKLKPKNPAVFLEYSGFFGASLPEHFLLVREQKNAKSVSYLVADPRLKKGDPWREQWFNSIHFKEV